LNSILRSKNRTQLISPWYLYLKLSLTALQKLPSHQATVYRGVRLALNHQYEVGKTYTWWGFSSCTESISVLKSNLLLGQDDQRTLFNIEYLSGKKISEHSSIDGGDEMLLLPGTQFIVKDHFVPSIHDPHLTIIQLRQVEPPFSLLESPTPGNSFHHHHIESKKRAKDMEFKTFLLNFYNLASQRSLVPSTNSTCKFLVH
jgi:hypothetical protein